MQVLFIYEAITVLVDHIEGLLELLDLGLVKHGKHIGSGPLRTLLAGLHLCPFAGHFATSVFDCQGERALKQNEGERMFKTTVSNVSKDRSGI